MRFYGTAAALPFRSAFLHLVKVSLAIGSMLAVMLAAQLFFLNNVWRWCADNLPAVTVLNGTASAEVAQPMVIEHRSGAGEPFAVIIDTTGATEGVDLKYRAGVLVKKRGSSSGSGRRSSRATISRTPRSPSTAATSRVSSSGGGGSPSSPRGSIRPRSPPSSSSPPPRRPSASSRRASAARGFRSGRCSR